MCVVCPALVKVITPPQMQVSMEMLSSAGALLSITVAAPGDQGVGVLGMQGMGVNTPSAAAVAAATMGLPGQLHMPKGGMFMMGMWSMMLAAIMWLVMMGLGVGTSVLGATPKVHFIMAPRQVCWGMSGLL